MGRHPRDSVGQSDDAIATTASGRVPASLCLVVVRFFAFGSGVARPAVILQQPLRALNTATLSGGDTLE